MKKILKFIFTGFAILILGGIAISACSGGGTDTKTSSEPSTKPAQTEQPKEQSKLTKENFDKITVGETLSGNGGMSYDEVVALLGKEKDHNQSTSTISGTTYTLDSYTWSEGVLSTKIITVQFTNGHVSNKMFNE